MEKRLKKHLDKLHAFDDERRAWLILSSFVVFAVLIILYSWDAIAHSKLVYAIGAFGLVLSVTWWYWTMRLIRHLIESKTDEYQLLTDIITMVRDVKEDVKKLQ